MDAIYNWSNHLIPNTRGHIERIASKVNERLAQGFDVTQTIDLLLGEGEDLDTVQKVVNHMLDQENEQMETTSSHERKTPVKYADVEDEVASLIKKLKPEEFSSIFPAKNSLMSFSDKKQEEFKELLWYARKHPEDRNQTAEVHSVMQPYVEQVIQDSQVLAKEAQGKKSFKFKKTAENVYRVSDKNSIYQVDLEGKTCTCSRYVLCGFNILGLSCEHILEASRQFDKHFTDDLVGNKTVFAQRYGNNIRYAWCSRANSEIVIENSCLASGCPFMQKDNGDTITCSFC